LLELAGNLSVSISMEDTPGLEGWLRKHFSLDLAINVTHILLDVEGVRIAASCGAHEEFSCIVLESVESARVLVELQVPQLLLFLALCVVLKVGHQVFNFLDLCFGISVQNHSKVFHHSEISAHRVCKTSKLAELWNKRHLVTSASVLVDKKRLVAVNNVFTVASLVVLLVACGSPLFIKRSFWTLRKINPVDFVGLLVVARNHSASFELLLDSFLGVKATSSSLVQQILQVIKGGVRSDNFEADVDVKKNSSFFHDEP